MATSEERRRRTERQEEKRRQDRICGYCRKKADGGVIDWAGHRRPLRIPICLACLARLLGSWRLIGDQGVRCAISEPRSLAGNPDSPQASVFLTSIIDEIVDVATYYMHYHAI